MKKKRLDDLVLLDDLVSKEENKIIAICKTCKRKYFLEKSPITESDEYMCKMCMEYFDCAKCKYSVLTVTPKKWLLDLYCKKSKKFLNRPIIKEIIFDIDKGSIEEKVRERNYEWTIPTWCPGFKKRGLFSCQHP